MRKGDKKSPHIPVGFEPTSLSAGPVQTRAAYSPFFDIIGSYLLCFTALLQT